VNAVPKQYDQWVPDALKDEPQEFATDPLSEAVGRREDLDVIRDPEIDAAPVITRVGNRAPQPVPAVVDHYAGPDPSAAPVVDHVDATAHLKERQPSADRFSDDEQGGASGYVDEEGDE
jgi:hypothetical protein